MKGLELAELFYRDSVDELFDGLDSVRARHAAGLVGEGSECFGFDDEVSHDHDWGPAFCIWLSEEDWLEHGAELQRRYDALTRSAFGGPDARSAQPRGATTRRTGIFSIPAFLGQLLGRPGIPAALDEWRTVPETGLACAVNGRVFEDGEGSFSALRAALGCYYPEDIRLLKIAGGCLRAAQAGQYNFARQAQRGEDVAAFLALARFADAALQAAFALVRRYRPFYKWEPRALAGTGPFGRQISALLAEALRVYRDGDWRDAAGKIEAVCATLADELRVRGLSDAEGSFLEPHAVCVATRIQDEACRACDLMQA